jgi:hypothetical protein
MNNYSIFTRILFVGLALVLILGMNPALSSAAIQEEAPIHNQQSLVSVSTVDGVPEDTGPAPQHPTSPTATDPAIPTDWLSTVQEQLRLAEYEITWQEQTYLPDVPAAYQAPNRAQNLRLYFTPQGLVIIPRTRAEDGLPWRWEASLQAWGRPGAMQPVEQAELAVKKNRVDYARGDGLAEWYLNEESGVTQGFTILAPPEEVEPDALLQLELAVGGNLVPTQASAQTGVEFRSSDGDSGLSYGLPQAIDATGRALPAWLELGETSLRIFVDDAQAVYPIQVSPSISQVSETADWSVQGSSANIQLGFRVATAGDVDGDLDSEVIIGAPYYDGGQTDEGIALLFLGSSTGLSTTYTWHQEGDQAGAHLGYAVATAGDVNGDGYADIIVGAPEYDSSSLIDNGAAWVYNGSASGPEAEAENVDYGDQADCRFGASVGTVGDVNGDHLADVFVGAPFYSNGQTREGMLWVWHGTVNGISHAHNWQAEGNGEEATFGFSASTAGDVNGDGYSDIIVGAYWYEHGQTDEGAAFIWHGSDNGLNNGVDGTPSNATWMGEKNDAGARYGFSVSTAGDVNGDGYADVIVGAPYYSNGESSEGGAFLYLGSSDGVTTTISNSDESNQAGARFGFSVSTAGDVNGDGYADVIVGAPDYTVTAANEGRAYVWYGHATGISATRDWDSAGGQANAAYGIMVATAGDVNGDGYSDIIVGAPGFASSAGKAFVYHGGPDGPEESASWTKLSNKEQSYFGFSVASAGDVNGDGYADVIVGAPMWDAGQPSEGRVFVYTGSINGLNSAPGWNKQSDQANAQFGFSVASAGDVNGDGYSDVIVGAPYYEGGPENEGYAWVYRGSSTGLIDAPYWTKYSNQANANFGYSVASAGDVNGDGYSDVIVGAPFYDYPTDNEGMAWVYLGSASGPHTAPDWHAAGGQTDAELGFSVASAGDVNRDGYSDVIVGAPLWHDDVTNEGRALVYLGSDSGLDEAAVWDAEGNNFNAQAGFSVASAGDVNGDGRSDVIVGAPHFGDGGLSSEGKVWVFHGTSLGVHTTADWYKEGGQNDAYYGYSVATAGDVNGDGYADVVIGAPHQTDTVSDEGTARVYAGSSSGLGSSYIWFDAGGQTLSWYGQSVASAEDVNGDGYADVLVGAPQYNGALTNEGKASLYYGNGGRGVSLRPRQRHYDGSPLAQLGRTKDTTKFSYELLCQSPFGRTGLDINSEIKVLNTAFNGIGTHRFNFYGNSAIGENQIVWFLALSKAQWYHWRIRWLYDPAMTPFMPASRWVTIPWNGWNEADFRTDERLLYLPTIRK